jgi:pyruvate,water dikinase
LLSGLRDLASWSLRRRDPPPTLETRITCFREVLHANNTALGLLASIQEALAGERRVSAADVRGLVAGVTVQCYRMVVHLNRMTGNRYRSLLTHFESLRAAISRQVEATPFLGDTAHVLGIEDLNAGMAAVVGQKSAYLGLARRVLPEHVPEGFATSETAYRAFMGTDDLGERVAAELASIVPGDVARSFAVAARVTQMIENTPVPEEVAAAITSRTARLQAHGASGFAVRSSALQEGGLELSFAGQYRSLLNVPAADMIDAFRSVIASKYSAEAITYRHERGFEDAEVAMCCCVLPMIDARTAGVLFSACRSEDGTITLIQAVRGLGLSAVDGSVRPETVVVERNNGVVVARRAGSQRVELRCAPGGGTSRIAVAEGTILQSALDDAHALRLTALARRLEEEIGTPVDVEWAIDDGDRPWILQVRPQPEHVEEGEVSRAPRVAVAEVLLGDGGRACGGVASGDAHVVHSDLDMLRFPAGGVLVTRDASPRLAVLLSKAAAIVADMGDVTGHLATVARELRVPALFGTEVATEMLAAAGEVTVDADARVVYRGRVGEALSRAARRAVAAPLSNHLERLARAAELIAPLTLRDRLASSYSPRRCRTVHDLIRFCHQATVEAMFDLGDRTLRRGGRLRKLVSEVPIDCRVFDLGGGVREGADEEIDIADVVSVPLRALWAGMTDPRLRWRTARPVSVKGFVSALVNYNFDQDARVRPMGEPSYAFVTADYVNLNSRIGYHFSTIDARICGAEESSYASFRFVGGSTGVEQRSRRARLIQRLLEAHGFETDCRADLVNARIRHRPRSEMESAMVLIGLVSGYVNHLDMALTSDGLVNTYVQEFMAGNVGFKGDPADA